ncbi:MAG TPA: glycosyltransferase [Alphaproteobacteria bacterium]|nr:glycosyltransferase [Alphaproteobacteria bacterium]
MKKILMIAFHYPPWSGGSGIERTLKFSRYLPEYGWQPLILTAHPRAYAQRGDEQLSNIPASVLVRRAFAMDVARHMSFRGAYPQWLALPDRWGSWWLGAVPAGLRLIRRYRPAVIWSTYPIATAHLIGLTLHRLTGIPWVADFRDSMTEETYPRDRMARCVYRWLECQIVRRCTCAVFTAPGTLQMYAARYPEIPQSRWAIIANGYDEEEFRGIEWTVGKRPSSMSQLVLVHSGVLYPSERDPGAFFAAVADLRKAGKISSRGLKIILRASGSEDTYRQLIRANGIEDIVFLEPPLPRRGALMEMIQADGLLLFQASNCNHQIPAKAYEYLRAKRPIFALTDPKGDTASLLRQMGINTIVRLDSTAQIAHGLQAFLSKLRDGHTLMGYGKEVCLHSRRSRALQLANLLDAHYVS